MVTTSPGRLGSAPLRYRDYRLLVTGASVMALGNSVTLVALAFAVIDLGGSAGDLGLVVAAFAVAQVITTLFGGVLGDRVSRQVMMEGAAAVAAVAQAVVGGLLVSGHATIALLTVLGVITGCAQALGDPSSRAMTRHTVPPDCLGAAVALRTLLKTSAATVGYAVGGVLVATIGSGWAVGVDAATFAVAAVCFRALRAPSERARSTGSMLGDLGDGVRIVLRRTWLWLLIGQAMVYHLFFGGAQAVLGPIVVGEGIGRTAWGMTMSALMAGFVLGGVLALRWRPRRRLYAGCWLLCLTALFPLAMALSDRLWVVMVGGFLHGFGLQIFDTFWELSIQEHVPDEALARVYAIDVAGSFVARPLGLALTGPLAELVGYRTWLVAVGCVLLLVELAALFSRDVRRLEKQTPVDSVEAAR